MSREFDEIHARAHERVTRLLLFEAAARVEKELVRIGLWAAEFALDDPRKELLARSLLKAAIAVARCVGMAEALTDSDIPIAPDLQPGAVSPEAN